MSNDHHHHNDQFAEQIANIAKSVVTSPDVVNRSIGTTMQHIGVALTLAATPYLPIQAD